MHAALSPAPDGAAQQPPLGDMRSSEEIIAALDRATRIVPALELEFARNPDVSLPGCAALLALTGPPELRGHAVLRVSCSELSVEHAELPDSFHVVPLEVRSQQAHVMDDSAKRLLRNPRSPNV